jgi:HlyD family secretion protein
VALVLLGAAVAAVMYFKAGDATGGSPKYTVAPVVRGDIVQSIRTTGQLAPLISVEVSTQISGQVTEVNVDFNSNVRKGDVLARIDPSTYEQNLRQAEANLAASRASHTLSKLNAERLQALREEDLVTQADYDQARASLEQSQAQLLTNEASVANARLDLERCTITSPIDGVVIFRQADVGKTVQASFSAPTLFVIARDLEKMRIIAPISEVDVWAVDAGQPVTFTVDAVPGRTFNGQLTQIRNPYTPADQKPQPGQQSTIASFDAVIEVDNQDLLLRPSLTANVSVIVERRESVLAIPNGALRVDPPADAISLAAPEEAGQQEQGSPAMVYRLPGGDRLARPEAVPVRIGITDSIVTEVIDGLREGDTVITGTPLTNDVPRGALRGML